MLPTMSIDYRMIDEHDWKEIDETKYEYYKPKFIKRFNIYEVIDVGTDDSMKDEDVRKIIKDEGFGNLALIAEFEIEFNGEKYILSAEMQDEGKEHVDAYVRFIYETPDSEKLMHDIAEKFNLSYEDEKEMMAYFFGEFPDFSDIIYKHDVYRSLESLVNEMGIVTDRDVFDDLRARVQAYALEEWGIDADAIEREEEEEREEERKAQIEANRKAEFSSPSF